MKYLLLLITLLVASAAIAQVKVEVKQFVLERSDAAQILAALDDAKLTPLSNDLCSKLLTLELYNEGNARRYQQGVTLNIKSDLYAKLGRRPPRGKPNTSACIAMKKTTRSDLCDVFRAALGAEGPVPCLGPGYVVINR